LGCSGDRPDIIDQIGETKEFKSARSAGIYCGVIKEKKTMTISIPEKMAQRLVDELDPESFIELINNMGEFLEPKEFPVSSGSPNLSSPACSDNESTLSTSA